MNLFNIQNQYLQLVSELIESEGLLTPELETALAINKADLETKGINYAFVIKSMESECDIIDSEIKRLTGLKKARTNAVDRLKTTLSNAMQLYEVTEIKSPIIKICFQNSKSVEVEDLDLLDPKFKKTSVPVVSADKVLIKKALENKEIVVGAVLRNNKNIQIK